MVLVNKTIDDTNGDPTTGKSITYSPASYWKLGPSCTTCDAKPDTSQAYDQTWRDTSYISHDLTAEVTFNGTAVYVYGIISLDNPAWVTSDLQFKIDGQNVGSYAQSSTDGTGFQYNTLFWSKQDLPSAEHTLTIFNGANKGPNPSLILLDKIVYSQEQADATSQSSQSSTTSMTTSSTNLPPLSGTNPLSTDTTTIASINVSITSTGSTSTTTASASNPSNSSDPSNSSSLLGTDHNHSKTPIILGSIVGVLSALVIASALLFFCIRHRRRNNMGPRWGTYLSNGTTPTMTEPPYRLPRSSFARPTAPPRSEPTSSTSPGVEGLGQATPTSLPYSRTSTYGGSEKGPSSTPPDVQTRMADTAMSLAAEVRRLREENDRLREVGSTRSNEDDGPPPYVHQP